jgi:hypothetical protein
VAATSRTLTPDALGAWLFKASPLEPSVDALVRAGFSGPSRWPVLLWVSGRDARTPAGLHAQGVTTGGADGSTGRLAVPVSLEPVSPPVLRSELVEHPVLSRSEVVRMPAGSNPSYLTREQLEALWDAWPQVHAGR